jgi:hypothetical protein
MQISTYKVKESKSLVIVIGKYSLWLKLGITEPYKKNRLYIYLVSGRMLVPNERVKSFHILN